MSNALGLGVGGNSTLSCDLSLIPCFFSSTTQGEFIMRVKREKTNQLRAVDARVGEWGPLLSSRGLDGQALSHVTVCSKYICAFFINVVMSLQEAKLI